MTLTIENVITTKLKPDDKSWFCNCEGCVMRRKHAQDNGKEYGD